MQTITLPNKWNTNRSAPISIGLECQTHVSTMVRNKQSLFSSQSKPQTTDWSSAKSTFRTGYDYHRRTRTEAHTSIHGFEKGIPEINLFYCNERRGYLLFTKLSPLVWLPHSRHAFYSHIQLPTFNLLKSKRLHVFYNLCVAGRELR